MSEVKGRWKCECCKKEFEAKDIDLVDGRMVCKEHNHTKDEDACKGCGVLGQGRWCTACYHEYHESKEELMGGGSDGEENEANDSE